MFYSFRFNRCVIILDANALQLHRRMCKRTASSQTECVQRLVINFFIGCIVYTFSFKPLTTHFPDQLIIETKRSDISSMNSTKNCFSRNFILKKWWFELSLESKNSLMQLKLAGIMLQLKLYQFIFISQF